MSETKDVRIPVPGEWWQYKTEINESPWPLDSGPVPGHLKVKILDVKEGWIRYKGVLGTDSRMKMTTFLYGFELAEPPVEKVEETEILVENTIHINTIEPSVNAGNLDQDLTNAISDNHLKIAVFVAFVAGVIVGVFIV